MKSKRILALPLAILAAGLALFAYACGGESQEEKARSAVPTYYSKNYPERQKFNRRVEVSDDPSTVLFCTAFPMDAEPYTVPIAAKLVSGQKRPEPVNNGADNGAIGTERADSQGMYGPSEPYRFGFTPGGVYVDFTNIPTVCETQAVNFKKTTIGLIAVTNTALTKAKDEAQEALRAGLTYGSGHHFVGYTPASQKKAQEILDNATSRESSGTVPSAAKGATK